MEPAANPEKTRWRVDLPSLFAAVVAGFIGLGSEPWWTLKGASSDNILTINISPFYLQITALGIPSTIPQAVILGSITRVLVLATAIFLGISAFRPEAWWRRLTVWLSLSCLAELYLSFILMIHYAELSLLNSYGATPPLLGTSNLPATILGLDLAYYQNPTLTATLAPPFFYGLTSLAILAGSQLYQTLHNPTPQLETSDLTKGYREIHLSPPFQHAWLSSGDEELNPLSRNPERLTDDQLTVSFQKLGRTVQPGGILSVIIPAWAGDLADRLLKLIPWIGFRPEKTNIIYRTEGKPENQIVFRKLVEKPKEEPTLELVVEGLPPPPPIMPEAPPLAPGPQAEPIWAPQEMTREERAMLRSATSIIEKRREAVPYRDLLNEVYMDLIDKNIEFDSSKQIETTLLKHAGKELAILEETDEENDKIVQKWWLGDKGVPTETVEPLNVLKRISRSAKPALPNVVRLVRKWGRQHRRAGYRPKQTQAEDN